MANIKSTKSWKETSVMIKDGRNSGPLMIQLHPGFIAVRVKGQHGEGFKLPYGLLYTLGAKAEAKVKMS